MLAVAVVLGGALFAYRGSHGHGTTLDAVPITLVTSDRDDLACASDLVAGGFRCQFRADHQPWPEARDARLRLAPYYSEDRRLFLIPGLFEQPALGARYERENPATHPRQSQRRFAARCKLRLVERARGFEIRWLTTDSWYPSTDAAWVAEASNCQIQER